MKRPETKCEHGRRRDRCKECKQLGIGGGGICEHNCVRLRCKECKQLGTGGSSICEHNRNRAECKKCKENGTGGSARCEHNNQRSTCKKCKQLGSGGICICEHNRQRGTCSTCCPERVFKLYQRSAQKRGYSFTLTLDEFQLIVFQPCLYCGEFEQPRGIDRWNNDIGYEYENCRSCCGPCNDMKGIMDGRTFVDHCEHITLHVEAVEQAEAQTEELLDWTEHEVNAT